MFDIKENLKKLPDTPGVYMHKDKLGQVIYVGKAISLKNRVRQYFQSYGKSTPKLRALTENIAEFEYITCATEMEALILENNLIKKYQPKYNVLLRDDKTYPYIAVTVNEPFPRVIKTRRLEKDGSRYFGPYSDVGAVNMIVDLLNRVYHLKRCNALVFPDGHRPCLNYHIQECRGICTGAVDQGEYREAVDRILEFLSGKEKPMVDSLTAEMQAAAAEMRFEDAARYRDLIRAAQELAETQRVTMIGAGDMDVVLPVSDGDHSFMVLFSVREGKLIGRETFPIQIGEGDTRAEMTGEFLKQYYSNWADVPHEILVEEEPPDARLIESFLGEGRHKVRIFVPKRGEKLALLKLAMHDRMEMVKTLTVKAESGREKRDALRQEIRDVLREAGYDRPPAGDEYRVESYDISNTNGVDSVGAMVVFSGTRRIRKDYRRFKIKTIVGPDDYGSLSEMLTRRFARADKGDPAFAVLPDAIFMDGGRGQVTAAKRVLDQTHFDIPVVGMAKDDSHRTRALVFEDGREIDLKDHPMLFHYCGTIQEEVHRFAIEYHRGLHGKRAIRSILDEIEGIGPVRRNALLARFGSVDAIKAATEEELMEVPEMSAAAADSVIAFFAKQSGEEEDKEQD
ncbi:MAG: excinuclease ABC subunit UvrC [Eubacterium sp.]|nr:excinuclease ABC subunit UvrC [Eubacterium sp.]